MHIPECDPVTGLQDSQIKSQLIRVWLGLRFVDGLHNRELSIVTSGKHVVYVLIFAFFSAKFLASVPCGARSD